MPTIYEIAEKAGVAPGTVSKVFNNYKQINEKTREKVLAVAKEMGYVPNIAASSIKTNQSYLIGVIFPENVGIGLNHQFFSAILESFRNRMGEHGYDTIFINNKLGNNTIGYLDHCKYRNVDGAFIITALEDDLDVKKLLNSHIKCVTTDMVIDQIPYVLSDNHEGAKLAVDYLYDQGHRKIGHIAGPLSTMPGGERFEGYLEALEALGISFDPMWMAESEWFTYEAAHEATLKYIEQFDADSMPTALFVSSDLMALAVIDALSTKKIKVPDDMSIVGFDDIEIAKYATPKLTTVHQNTKVIGETVADTLYRSILDESQHIMVPRVPVSLIIRESVMTFIK